METITTITRTISAENAPLFIPLCIKWGAVITDDMTEAEKLAECERVYSQYKKMTYIETEKQELRQFVNSYFGDKDADIRDPLMQAIDNDEIIRVETTYKYDNE